MVRCNHCKKIVWPWQSVGSFGPVRHTRRTAASVKHMVCIRARSKELHSRPHPRMAACWIWECTNNIEVLEEE